MEKMSGFMKKTILVIAVVLAAVSFLPKNAEAATVKMSQKKATCTAKERFTLKVKGTSKKATWTSSNKSVATVTKKGGNVVTKKAGKTTITATVGNKKVKCKVTVKKPAAKPFLTVSQKSLHVGESFLILEGWYTDYESTFSFNDHIATINPDGKVTATGIGTTKVLVNRGQKNGTYLDYYCTITVVAGTAPTCNHQWMDTSKYKSSGVWNGPAFIQKTWRDEAYNECVGCHEKVFSDEDIVAHILAVVNNKNHGSCDYITAGGGTSHNMVKFEDYRYYCRLCGDCKY